ncbi:hypothetical protein E4T56_gene5105 [Termitomyces sp. T112]|nr:hypothetical protein E4T56_gene5105 [Termitomyces sp. T112]
MKATSSAQCSTVASLLAQEYSLCQIEAKTGLGKFNIRRIGGELEVDKINHPEDHLAKLILYDKQTIVQQISAVDTAVQATNFINNIISNPVSPQTVLNVLKEERLWHHFQSSPMLCQTPPTLVHPLHPLQLLTHPLNSPELLKLSPPLLTVMAHSLDPHTLPNKPPSLQDLL